MKNINMEEFYEAWQYLSELEAVHYKGINRMDLCLYTEVVKVNPETNEIDDDDSKNTKVEVWLEFGGVTYDETHKALMAYHDIELDCGGDTFEEAIIELASLAKKNGYK